MPKKKPRKLTDDEAVELLIDALIALGRSDCETIHASTALDAGRKTMIGLITGL